MKACFRSNDDPVTATVNMLQNHPSVIDIKQEEFNTISRFNNTNENEDGKMTKNLNIRITFERSDIRTKINT